MTEVVHFTAQQTRDNLCMSELVRVVERGLGNFSEKDGGVLQPVRMVLPVDNTNDLPSGFFGCMPVYSPKDKALASKIGCFYPHNGQFGKSTHITTVLLYDPEYGELQAIVDGDVITEMRTAAASAAASKHLVRHPEAPKKLAILGAGLQARSHVLALRQVFTFSEIRIWSRTMESAMKCAEEVGGEACLSAEEAVNDADIIVTVTLSSTPILKKAWVKEGCHINAVGAFRADRAEVDADLMRNAVVYVDTKAAALKEAGDIIIADAEIYAEIGEIINGTKEAKYEPYTVFKSIGMAMEDAVAAKLVYETYIAKKSKI